ncbi:MAG: DUF3108 domain-containing protein [Odoribacter sp.]|nr:DUF3108 domain-containing protein [Odoribacter sp.]
MIFVANKGFEKGRKMKKLLPVIIAFVVLTADLTGQNHTYKAGEKIQYIIHYGLINGGIASLELQKDTFAGEEVLRSVFIAQTTGLADALFKVRDVYESYINPETQLPVKSIRNISEGKYRKYNLVLFDHNTRKDSAILTSDLSGKHVTIQGIHDILSCFYYFRKSIMSYNPVLKKGDMITITTWFTDELYPIRLRYIGMDDVRTRAGRVKCYKFNPVTESGRLFKDEEGATFWFSADKNYLPVKARFEIFVGAFTVDLNSYEGLSVPLDIKVREE